MFEPFRLQNKESVGEDKRRAKKDKPKTIIEGPVRRWTPKRGTFAVSTLYDFN